MWRLVNPNLNTEKYAILRIDDLFAEVNGFKYFSKIDLSQAYAQIILDEEARKLCTINTHKGLFRYNRLPYGISSAPGIFQRIVEQTCRKIKGVIIFLDDILIGGRTEEELLQNLYRVFQILQEIVLKVKLNKCKFFQKSVSYLGFTVDEHGLHPNQNRITAI